MTRVNQRRLWLLAFLGLSSFLVYTGWQGWRANGIPTQYFGYLFGAFAVAGLCGVNIWYGGPFDPRFDPPPTETDDGQESTFPVDDSNPYSAPRSRTSHTPGPAPRSVQIIGVPPGEAPEEIRRCWVGLTLPLAVAGPQSRLGSGVLTGPRGLGATITHFFAGKLVRHDGYIVDASAAVEILAAHSPHAAKWWREHVPHAVRPGRKFIFAAQVCREVG
jgi:hypothetical protein